MVQLTNKRLQEVLTKELQLRDPEFHLRRSRNRIDGSVVSPTFKGMGDYKRQTRIWNALDEALGKDSTRLVGMLLAFTPDEWHIDLEGSPPAITRKKQSKTHN